LTASPITFDFDHTLNGAPPIGPTPWLTAAFASVANGVQLTLSAPGLTGSESVNQFFFNLNPTLNPASLNFTETGSVGSFAGPTVATGVDSFKPPWDGKYDVMVSFNSAQFIGGDSVTLSITGIAGLNANDFLFRNSPTAGHAANFAAADITTVGEAVVLDTPPPVPDGASTMLLLGLGVLAGECVRRKLSNKSETAS